MADLDPASIIIGELKGQFSGMEKYIHKQFHDQAQGTQVQFGFLEKILKELKELKESDFKTNSDTHHELEERIAALETINTRRDGIAGAADWFLNSRFVSFISWAALATYVYFTGKSG